MIRPNGHYYLKVLLQVLIKGQITQISQAWWTSSEFVVQQVGEDKHSKYGGDTHNQALNH